MLQVEIHIPRPLLTLGLIAGAVFLFLHHGAPAPVNAAADGGDDGQEQAMAVHNAEDDIKKVREQQSVLDHQEQILRAELAALETELNQTQDQATAAQLVQTRDQLLSLLNDRRTNEQQILQSLKQIWDAQGVAVTASEASPSGTEAPMFEWPVNPALGISATFHDPAYFKQFGMQHEAIDIPIAQSSLIHAAADGVIVKVSDNGMGYSSLVISHNGGFATLYGHVSGFLVHEGDHVHAGQAVALSGGTPGTKGAGHMTTGAHLHFEMLQNGTHVDPLTYLPKLAH